MLRQRILTAAVLLALLLPALVIDEVWPFAALTMAAMALAGWEWSRLNEAGALAVPLGLALGGACALAFHAGWTTSAPRLAWWLAFLAWVLGGTWVLRAGVAGWPRVPRPLRWTIGLVALWTTWLALANAKAIGLNFILSVFFLVWSADVFAYFGGRALGKRKLAPGISPGKSWEGVWSGMVGALLVATAWLAIDAAGSLGTESFYTIAANRFGYLGLAGLVVFLVAMSVVGDLFESLVKRSAGAKDSSALLPGHGGILDRIDGLLPVFPIALALVML
ncbi:MAG: phosphatidate cytidylyltransferase [Pseudomonadota bacterium]|nr:phosphatidate cytidylyltransferase [Pseudomonadota bacterium]